MRSEYQGIARYNRLKRERANRVSRGIVDVYLAIRNFLSSSVHLGRNSGERICRERGLLVILFRFIRAWQSEGNDDRRRSFCWLEKRRQECQKLFHWFADFSKLSKYINIFFLTIFARANEKTHLTLINSSLQSSMISKDTVFLQLVHFLELFCMYRSWSPICHASLSARRIFFQIVENFQERDQLGEAREQGRTRSFSEGAGKKPPPPVRSRGPVIRMDNGDNNPFLASIKSVAATRRARERVGTQQCRKNLFSNYSFSCKAKLCAFLLISENPLALSVIFFSSHNWTMVIPSNCKG